MNFPSVLYGPIYPKRFSANKTVTPGVSQPSFIFLPRVANARTQNAFISSFQYGNPGKKPLFALLTERTAAQPRGPAAVISSPWNFASIFDSRRVLSAARESRRVRACMHAAEMQVDAEPAALSINVVSRCTMHNPGPPAYVTVSTRARRRRHPPSLAFL